MVFSVLFSYFPWTRQNGKRTCLIHISAEIHHSHSHDFVKDWQDCGVVLKLGTINLTNWSLSTLARLQQFDRFVTSAVVVNIVWSTGRVLSVPCIWSDDPPPYEHNFLSNCAERPEKFRNSMGFEPVTSLCWPVRWSNQLSYKATDGGSCSILCSNVPMMNETIDKMIVYLQLISYIILSILLWIWAIRAPFF